MLKRSEQNPGFRDIIAARVNRRGFLLGSAAGLSAVASTGFVGSLFSGEAAAAAMQSSLGFAELKRVYDDKHRVAEGYRADLVVAWGDPMKADQPAFSGALPTAAEQAERFGYNCDFVAFMPLPKGSGSSDHGLLCVNNEYVSANVMFPDMKEDDFDRVIRVNLKGAFLVAQAAAKLMVKSKTKGAIVNMSSVNAVLAIPGLAAYNVSKGGINQLTRVMALELVNHGIRVNAVAPGWVITERQQKLWVTKEALAAHVAKQCIREVMQPEDMVGTCLFLASDASRMLTAQTLIVDGGFL